MYLTFCAYAALTVCLAGTLWRMGRWFCIAVGPESKKVRQHQRLAAFFAALPQLLTPCTMWALSRAVVLDVLLQRQIARQNLGRWCMHMGLSYGVALLILVHALEDNIMAEWVVDYASTLNPWMWLRHLLGMLMLAGLGIAVFRRHTVKQLKRFSSWTDRLPLILLGTVLFSGIALEATQIISSSIFDEMVVDYWGSEDQEEIAPLKTYWADQFAVAFSTPPDTGRTIWEQGRQLHVAYCADCHSKPHSAFMAYPAALAIKPMAAWLEGVRFDLLLWQLHYLVSCLALACLPFGKLFHLVSVPISLAVSAVGPAQANTPQLRPTRRAMGLDACTHCGVCTRHCSVAPIMSVIDNQAILPSEKIGEVKRLARGRLCREDQWRLAQGSDICTACGRCTDECPSGIDLQDLWQASKEDLADDGCTPPHQWIRNNTMVKWADQARSRPDRRADVSSSDDVGPHLTDNPGTFWACVQCTTCTTVCPVVAASGNPNKDLNMTPQQVMNLMRLELKEMALGCRMVWDCVTCYKCQEHCPQGVPVADVLYELRNEACARLTPEPPTESASYRKGLGQNGDGED